MSSPILTPDGSVRMIPNEQADAAVNAGGKRVVRMSDPTGTARWIPQESVPDAIKAGARPQAAAPLDYSSMRPQDMAQQAMQQSGVNKFVSSPATPPNVNMQEQAPTRLGAYGNAVAQNNQNMNKVSSAVGQDVGGLAKGLPGQALRTMTYGPIAPISDMASSFYRSARDPNQSAAETAGLAVGANSPAIKKAAQAGDYPSLIGHSMLPLALALGGGRLASENVVKPFGSAEARTIPTEQAAKVVTDTVNPPKNLMEGFEESVNKTLPEVSAKMPTPQGGWTRAKLADAFQNLADQKYDSYYKSVIQPIAQDTLPTKNISGYQGMTRGSAGYGEGALTTVGDLEKRLSTINDTLRPSFQKGGLTAEATLGAENKVAYTAEAAGIRKTLNGYIAKKYDIPYEQAADMRSQFGAMRDVADKMKLALADERHAINTARNEPVTLNTNVTGAALRGLEKVRDAVRGRPADRALNDAMQKYQSPFQEPSSPTMLDRMNAPSVRPNPVPWPSDSPVPLEQPSFSSPSQIQANLASQLSNRFNRAKQSPLPLTHGLSDAQLQAIKQAAINRSQR